MRKASSLSSTTMLSLMARRFPCCWALVLRCVVVAAFVRINFLAHGFLSMHSLPVVQQRQRHSFHHGLAKSDDSGEPRTKDPPKSRQGPAKDGSNDNPCVISPMDRRSLLRGSFLLPSLLGISSVAIPPCPSSNAAAAAETTQRDAMAATAAAERLSNELVQSLVFDKVLGSGSYKTVYLVSARVPPATGEENADGIPTLRYAMAVQILNTQRDVKDAFRGVRIPGVIAQSLDDDGDSDRALFETIVDWWVQPKPPEFAAGRRVFPGLASHSGSVPDPDGVLKRSRAPPKRNFAGSRWMVSFKPVYEIDLERFIRKSPALAPVGGRGAKTLDTDPYWTEAVLLRFVLEILHAGRLMHRAGIVHRDIKPKNIMVTTTREGIKRPVLIDYGYSEVGSPVTLEGKGTKSATDICVVYPGQLKGEVGYVLAEDAEHYRGCQRGDAYALGKTLYEFVFGDSGLQADDLPVLTLEGAALQNDLFRNKDLLFDDATAGSVSRFPLSREASACLLSVMRGLCGNQRDGVDALTIARAETILSEFVASSSRYR